MEHRETNEFEFEVLDGDWEVVVCDEEPGSCVPRADCSFPTLAVELKARVLFDPRAQEIPPMT
jgi:hypothetical protein